MLSPIQTAAKEPNALFGDAQPLLEQLGAPGELVSLAEIGAALQTRRVDSLPTLRNFLLGYRAQVLVPVEFPAILRAHRHLTRYEGRELIEFDRELAAQPLLAEFAGASRCVGRSQLRKLWPLRDHRALQRYRQAVDEGEANGWHSIVFGVALGVYTLPLRQGLVHYGQRTLHGFIEAAAETLRINEETTLQLLKEVIDPLPDETNALLNAA
jgi:urease accessory protein UreF